MTRRHDIDALRVIAFGLLILYHAGMLYVADWDFHLKSSYLSEGLQGPMIALNRWRMPLLFLISGIALGLLRPQQLGRAALLRSWRLLLPLLFGMFVVVPVQPYCEALAHGRIEAGFGQFLLRYWQVRPWPPGTFTGAAFGITWNHLWYLAYLWPYTMLLLAALAVLRQPWLQAPLAWLCGVRVPTAVWWLLPIAWESFNLLWVMPRWEPTHALFGDWYVHAQSLPLFLLGYAVARHDTFWARLRHWRWSALGMAVLCASIELGLRAAGRHHVEVQGVWAQLPWAEIERVARAGYTWTALLAIFGWGQVWLDRPFRWLPYCTEAVYPWYMLHQSVMIVLAFWLIPMHLGPVVEPLLVIAGTAAGCLLLHEGVIRRVAWLRPCFGLKARRREPVPALAPATAAR
jgi:surface polysaccharide O-acyltransferase-like enzyme